MRKRRGERVIGLAVDGSFNQSMEAIGIGFVVFEEESGEVLHEYSGYYRDTLYCKSRQVGGELLAAVLGMLWCLQNGYNKVRIYYDFKGVKDYICLNQLRKAVTQEYMKMMTVLIMACGESVAFEKVKGHSGHRWNDIADRLAGEYRVDDSEYIDTVREQLLAGFEKEVLSKRKG